MADYCWKNLVIPTYNRLGGILYFSPLPPHPPAWTNCICDTEDAEEFCLVAEEKILGTNKDKVKKKALFTRVDPFSNCFRLVSGPVV